jgi:hypothetical protein
MLHKSLYKWHTDNGIRSCVFSSTTSDFDTTGRQHHLLPIRQYYKTISSSANHVQTECIYNIQSLLQHFLSKCAKFTYIVTIVLVSFTLYFSNKTPLYELGFCLVCRTANDSCAWQWVVLNNKIKTITCAWQKTVEKKCLLITKENKRAIYIHYDSEITVIKYDI